ncbi:MAG: hypothetical protein ACFFDW_17200 [Candidatus Thorarchaeota archaeon]
MKKEVAEDLISYKLRQIQALIEDILTRWNETSAEQFLQKAKDGRHENAENDAIALRQLLLEEEKLHKLLENLK